MKVILLTANDNEKNTVRHFLGGQCFSLKNKDVKGHTFKNDPILKKIAVEIQYNISNGDLLYDLATIGATKVVHMKIGCDYGKTEAKSAVDKLLEKAKEQNWPLEIIFCVGCCGCSSDTEGTNFCGHVLLSKDGAGYTSKKTENGWEIKNPSPYNMDKSWVQLLGDEPVYFPGEHPIKVTKADCIYSGDTLIADPVVGTQLRDRRKLIGIEMEGSGIARGLTECDTLPGTLKSHKFLVVKGVSDNADSGKNKKIETLLFGEKRGPLNDDERQEVATLQSVALVCRAIATRYKN